MKKYHYFIVDFPLGSSCYEIVDPELVHRLVHVLKLSVGEKIMLSNGAGKEVDATVVSINQKKVLVELGMVHSSQHELSYNLRLYCSLVKREVFETVVKQATELGVREIIPLVSDRTIKTRLNVQRLEKIIREAAEQSERGYVPKLLSPVEFKKSVSEPTSSASKIFVFDRSGLPMYEVLHSNPVAPSSIDVYIGPEGGWSEAELEFIRAHDISIVSFGTTILRTDTAVVAGLLYTRFLH